MFWSIFLIKLQTAASVIRHLKMFSNESANKALDKVKRRQSCYFKLQYSFYR